MKTLLISLIVLFISSLCYGDFVVIYDKGTKEIINIADSEKSLQFAQSDKDKIDFKIMTGDISDYNLDGPVQNYKLSGNKIVVNTKKVSDAVASKELDDEISKEQKLINKKLQDIAITELKKDGIELKHFK